MDVVHPSSQKVLVSTGCEEGESAASLELKFHQWASVFVQCCLLICHLCPTSPLLMDTGYIRFGWDLGFYVIGHALLTFFLLVCIVSRANIYHPCLSTGPQGLVKALGDMGGVN
jgi:hypothetical protein